MDLFSRTAQREKRGEPLAARMRPRTLDAFCGQRHLLGGNKLLQRVITEDRVPSLVLWGPPGSGKTTLARIIAERTGARFATLSAVGSGVKELRAEITRAAEQRDTYSRRTILFVDEIHRFNKAQQDALLPHVEAGTVVLIGATTENPSFEVNAALLSRLRVLRLEALSAADLQQIMRRALREDRLLRQRSVTVSPDALEMIAKAADGDARRALNAMELAIDLAPPGESVERALAEQALQQKMLLYDKGGEEHYNIVSAFIKSMRGSDPDAAVYWMARMLEAGEDPLFVMRRMVIFAAEDVGNADPQGLILATAALQAVRFIGLPEAVLPMTQACTYLATAPKSNSALTAYGRARAAVREHGPLPVPLHLRNAPTALMRAAGYGKDYRYPHDYEGHKVAQRYLPDALVGQRYYQPSESGHEAVIRSRMRQQNLDISPISAVYDVGENDTMTSKLKISAMAATRDKKQLNQEWIELLNEGETAFNSEGCALTVARGGGRQRTVTTLKAGLIIQGGERVRLVSGSSGKKSHGDPPEEDGVRNFYLFLKAPYLERPGLVVRLVNPQHTEICKGAFGETEA